MSMANNDVISDDHGDVVFDLPGLMPTVSKDVVGLEDNDEVKALAARLAPQVEQLDALLAHPVPESSMHSSTKSDMERRMTAAAYDDDDDDDDDLGAELEQLNISSQLLRQELEFAHDFGSWLSRSAENTPRYGGMMENDFIEYDNDNNNNVILEPNHHLITTAGAEATATARQGQQPPGISTAPRRELFPLSTELEMDSEGPADDIFPIPTPEPQKDATTSSGFWNSTKSVSSSSKSPRPYSLQDHAKTLRISTEPRGGWYLVDVSSYYCSDETQQQQQQQQQQDSEPVVQEYCLSLPVKDLQRLYVGASDLFQSGSQQQRRHPVDSTPSGSSSSAVEESPLISPAPQWTTTSGSTGNTTTPYTSRNISEVLPVRTTAVRIRPDVLCGAVMDALHHALQGLQNADVWKRQGGHIVAIVGGTTRSSSGNNHSNSKDVVLPPYVIHAQLCTHKSNDSGGRRILLLQTYHVTSAAAASKAANGPSDWTIPPTRTVHVDATSSDDAQGVADVDDDQYIGSHDNDEAIEREVTSNQMLEHVKEACALIQRMETTPQKSPFIPKVGSSPPPSRFSWLGNNTPSVEPLGGIFGSPTSMRQAVSAHLLQHTQPCPSVQNGGLTIPALSNADWQVLVSSSRWLAAAFEELETRDLTYNTLQESRFGAFPALPTLDVHYCSQMRRLSRERMILQLLQSASQLEEFAREAEYACANLISMLQPMFESYDMEPPPLPQPVPLTAYRLDFVAPQAACPPWGFKVMEALNMVSAMTSDANTKQIRQLNATSFSDAPSEADATQSFQMAQEAVDLIYDAFTKQDDEERGARLGRKNAQVLDRLAKMQAHQQACLFALRDGDTRKALAAANDFFAKAQLANNHMEASPQVPLLKSSIVVGSSTGSCFVTATHLLFVTQLIPYLGGTKATLLNLQDIKFRLQDHTNEASPQLSTLLLLPRPPASIAVIDVQSRRTVMTFRPAVAASWFFRVLEVIRSSASPQLAQPYGGPMDREGSTSSLDDPE